MNQQKTSILLVDDDHTVRSFARIILEHEGWQVEEAGSLREAFEQVRSCGFRPHVTVVDILLPDGVGTELVGDLRQARPKSKVIFITGDPGWLRRLNAHAQADAVLAKPFTPVQLVVAVRSALETMRPVVVIVESGRVYQRLIGSALEQESVKLATASSFDEGLQLASETGAAVLFTPEPEEDGALARLLDLRREMPALAVVALASDGPRPAASWYDRRLIPPYSAQSVGDTILHVLNVKTQIESVPPEWACASKNGH